MKTTLFLALLLLSLNSEGASADRSAEDIAAIAAARREAINAKQRERRAANREKEAERYRKRRKDPKIGAKIKAQQRAYRAANPEKIKEKDRAYRAANRERRNAQQRAYRAACTRDIKKKAEQKKQLLESASSWLVGGKPLFDVEPLGPDEDVHVDLTGFAFSAGGRKRARSDGAKGGPATKK